MGMPARSSRRTAFALLVIAFAGAIAPAVAIAGCQHPIRVLEERLATAARPTPGTVEVSLAAERRDFLLGEDVRVQYRVRHASGAPIWIPSRCGRGMRPFEYMVSARDPDGRIVADINPEWGEPRDCSGLSSKEDHDVAPGGVWSDDVPILRYLAIERPGVYQVQICRDFGWDDAGYDDAATAEIELEFHAPTEEQAKAVVASMEILPRREPGIAYKDHSKHAQDFTATRFPIYLPILVERARAGVVGAIDGLATMEAREATAALFELSEHRNPEVAVYALRALLERVPGAVACNRTAIDASEARASNERACRIVSTTWIPELGARLRTRALALLDSNDRGDRRLGATLLGLTGTRDDIPALTRLREQVRAAVDEAEAQGTIGSTTRIDLDDVTRDLNRLWSRTVPTPG